MNKQSSTQNHDDDDYDDDDDHGKCILIKSLRNDDPSCLKTSSSKHFQSVFQLI